MKKRLEAIAALLGLDLEWRDCYGNGAHQEAYVVGPAVRKVLTKYLGKPTKEKDGDQTFWGYTPSAKLKALGVKELYIEKYNYSSLLVVQLVVRKKK